MHLSANIAEVSLDRSRRLAATDNEQRAVARCIFAVLIPHETINESIRHGGRAKVFDYLVSGRLQLNFPVIASPLCIDLTPRR
jgi:hypothetical protein